MKYIMGFAGLIAMAAAPVLMGCMAEPGSSGEANNSDESRVGEAASAYTRARVVTGGNPYVNLRTGPGTFYAIAGRLYEGDIVGIVCTEYGEPVRGVLGNSAIWNKLDNGLYVSDNFVYTGTSQPVEPSCPIPFPGARGGE